MGRKSTTSIDGMRATRTVLLTTMLAAVATQTDFLSLPYLSDDAEDAMH